MQHMQMSFRTDPGVMPAFTETFVSLDIADAEAITFSINLVLRSPWLHAF